MADTEHGPVPDLVTTDEISRALEAATRMAMEPRLLACLAPELARELETIRRCVDELMSMRLLLAKFQQGQRWFG